MTYQPGDFILTHGDAFYSKLIRVGEWMRYHDPRWTKYNHAAMIVSTGGDLVEALGNGVVRTNISKYRLNEYQIIDVSSVAPTINDRMRVVRFAISCIGQPYDWTDILSVSISLLTNAKLCIETEGHMICSGLVARALERSTAIFPRSAQHMMPADLAEYFQQ
jgi:uncharacterized protein YycO